MNGLSWMLYLADVIGNLGPLLVAGGGVVILAGLAAAVGGSTLAADRYEDEKGRAEWRSIAKRGWMALAVGGFLVLCAAFVPSRNTVMLIAASEVGETVLASKEAQNIGGEAGALATDSLRLLRKYVTEQLGDDGNEAGK